MTTIDWQDVAETAAEESRIGDTEERLHIAEVLGLPDERDRLEGWIGDDAIDSLSLIALEVTQGRALHIATAATLAAHTEIGIRLGVWLCRNGLVAA